MKKPCSGDKKHDKYVYFIWVCSIILMSYMRYYVHFDDLL